MYTHLHILILILIYTPIYTSMHTSDQQCAALALPALLDEGVLLLA